MHCYLRVAMRKITKFAVSAVALAGIAHAEVETSAYAGVHSKYIYRGSDLGDNLVDFGLDLAGSCDCGLDWYAGVWDASVEDADAEETDVFAGISKDLGFGAIDLGGIVYTYSDATKREAEGYIGLSTSVAGLDLGLTYSHGFDGAVDGTNWIEGTIGYGIELAGQAIGLELGAGSTNKDGGLGYYSATASTDVALSEAITLSPYVSYVQTGEEISGDDGFFGGASLSFSF